MEERARPIESPKKPSAKLLIILRIACVRVNFLGARVCRSSILLASGYLRVSPPAHLFSLDVDGVPFSPPGHDDSFFYIRYPTGGAGASNKTAEAAGANEKLSITDQIRAATGNAPVGSGLGQITAAVKGMNLVDAKNGGTAKVDLSKHTEPCRQYLAGANGKRHSNDSLCLTLRVLLSGKSE